jgi:hypothetical protein
MKGNGLSLLLSSAMILSGVLAVAQPGCSPPATNTSCATAVALTVDANCINGTTCAGGPQSASTCLFAGSQCVWYRFTATATSMYVNVDVTATSGCHISSNVYSSTGPCTGLTQISCLSGAPIDDMHPLTGLTVGGTYYIQVCYSPGGPCGSNGSAQFCIEVGVPDPPCNTCSTPCGDAYGYTTNPTVAQVVADCQSDPFGPPLQPGSTHTFCNAFTATNTTVSFNVVITSDCGMGNVTNFSWALYSSPSCGGAIQTGTLASLTFTGLTIGATYVFCYTFTVPTSCTHTQHCPYFVGATVPLPVTWLEMDARLVGPRSVEVTWATATEQNTSHFEVQRSMDAVHYEHVASVPAAGQSLSTIWYSAIDDDPEQGPNYYRIEQVDLDGTRDFSRVVVVDVEGVLSPLRIFPNPVTGDAHVTFIAYSEEEMTMELTDASGRLAWMARLSPSVGPNTVALETGPIAPGLYMLSIRNAYYLNSTRLDKH